MANFEISSHPVIQHKLTKLRDKETTNKQFREILCEITAYLGYIATSDLEVVDVKKSGPIGEFTGKKLKSNVALIPILRAGLGMVDSMLDILPQADVHHIGMYRNKTSDLPVLYYNKLPKEANADVAIVLEPLIATSGTISAVLDILKQWGVKTIKVVCVLASKPGLEKLLVSHPDVKVHCVAVDDKVSDAGKVLPGLGDVGDRQFTSDREVGVNGKRKRK